MRRWVQMPTRDFKPCHRITFNNLHPGDVFTFEGRDDLWVKINNLHNEIMCISTDQKTVTQDVRLNDVVNWKGTNYSLTEKKWNIVSHKPTVADVAAGLSANERAWVICDPYKEPGLIQDESILLEVSPSSVYEESKPAAMYKPRTWRRNCTVLAIAAQEEVDE